MGTMPIGELLLLYAREEITQEQVLGHILQNLVNMQKLLEMALKEIERLKAFVGMEEGGMQNGELRMQN